jgi:DNA mismatch repair protein MutS
MKQARLILALSLSHLLIASNSLLAKIPLAPIIAQINELCLNANNITKPELTSANDEINKPKFQLPKWKKRELSQFERHTIPFQILEEYAKKTDLHIESIIDPIFIKKMELFCGGENKNATLFAQFNKTHSTLGAAVLAAKLVQPTADVQTLTARQTILKEFTKNNHMLEELDTLFANMKANEEQLFLLWQKNMDILSKQMSEAHYSILFDSLNKNAPYLEFTKRFTNINQAWTIVGSGIGAIALPIFGLMSQDNATRTFSIAYSALLGFSAYLVTQQAIQLESALRDMQGQLIDIASYTHYLKQVNTIIQSNDTLRKSIPSVQTIGKFAAYSEEKTAELQNLLTQLETNTFKGKPSFFSYQGRVLAVNRILRDIKEEMVPALIAAAEIEAFVSIARVCQESQGNRVQYSFVDFVTSDTPYIKATNFWNPFVDQSVVVPNSLTLSKDTSLNAIITGPNTGGKSTIIKSLLIDLLLAQTFGIAPAEKMVMTPFARINCYLNITDDIAAGVSLFKAEVLRAKELINSVKSLPQGAFSFTIMDEVFSGTSPKEGEEAAYTFSKRLAEFSNSSTIIATHFKQLTELPNDTNGSFSNHHVEIIRHNDGRIERTFRLKQGPSFVNIALDILKEEGVL